jgi:hypothetical protein
MDRNELIGRIVDRKLAASGPKRPFCVCLAGKPRGQNGSRPAAKK